MISSLDDRKNQLVQMEKELTMMTTMESGIRDLLNDADKTLQEQKPVSTDPSKCRQENDVVKVCVV